MLAVVVGGFLAATIVGLVVLWPPSTTMRLTGGELGTPVDLVDATVVAAPVVPCHSALPGVALTCRDVTARLDGGPEKGQTTTLDITEGPDQPTLRAGDRVVLGRAADPGSDVAYYFSDYQRRTPLLALGLLFAVAVVGLARWRGAAALLGLAVSLLVLVKFVLPALLAGESAVAVAVVGSSLIAVVIIYLAHGVTARTTTAVLGTLVSLWLTAGLAVVFVELTRLTGLASEEGTYLRGLLGGRVNVQGLLLGGIVIGALGVLNDVTVTQASAVWEIYLANPATGARPLYRSAMRIGRDHIASTVDTLVLAYAGAALPLFVVFTVAGRGLGDVLTGELVAEEVVRTLVGSLGLVAAVPVTTGLACLLATRSVRRRQAGPAG
ncbi:MAG: YibE/F family protein [Actinomycetota bacterium]|nr:YibE/F family protein [Actinomycetota bacterium]